MKRGNRNFAIVLKSLLSTSLALAVCLAPFGKCAWAQRENPQIDQSQSLSDINLTAKEIEKIASNFRSVLTTIRTQAMSIEADASSSAQPPEARLNRIRSFSQSIDGLASSINSSAGAVKNRARDISERSRAIQRSIAGAEKLVDSAKTIEESASSIQSSSATIGSQARSINTLASDRRSSPRFDEIIDVNRALLAQTLLSLKAEAAIITAVAAMYGILAVWNEKADKIREILDRPENRDEMRMGNRTAQTATSSAAYKRNEIFGGFSLIREDSEPERFNTYGFDVSLTRYLNERFGFTGDVSAAFKHLDGSDLSKYSLTGGIKVMPFDGATTQDRATIFTQALFGVAHFKSDFGTGSFTDNSFTMKLGGGMDVKLTRNFFITPFAADYNPTYFGNRTQHNFQFSFGAGFRF